MNSPVYHLPAEWQSQSSIMLTWPHKDTDWADILDEVEPVYLQISQAVLERQNLIICCHNTAEQERVSALISSFCGDTKFSFHIYTAPTNDTWARDHGPITVVDESGEATIVDFRFNAWGGKFIFDDDNLINSKLHQQGAFGKASLKSESFVLEGGSIESDGKGTILTTSQCLMTDTRNPGLSKTDIEGLLATTLGAQRILWLNHGYLAGDDTDSHVDTLARLCSEDLICYVGCDDEQDEHYNALKAMELELQSFRQTNGQPYRLVRLPMVSAVYDDDHRLPATYANFLIINGAVLFPVYGTPEDSDAIRAIQTCFPDREIIAINCTPLVKQHGSLHCITMQIPEQVNDAR